MAIILYVRICIRYYRIQLARTAEAATTIQCYHLLVKICGAWVFQLYAAVHVLVTGFCEFLR